MTCQTTRCGLTTSARVSTSTPAAPAAFRARAQPSRVAPVVRTSSISRTRRPSICARRRAGTAKAPATLRVRAARPDFCGAVRFRLMRTSGLERAASLSRHALGQQGSLVVAAGPEPGPMERHRGDQIRLGQKLRTGPRQPAPEERRQIGPVGMFEGEQHRPAAGIVAQHRAAPVIDRRAGKTGGA